MSRSSFGCISLLSLLPVWAHQLSYKTHRRLNLAFSPEWVLPAKAKDSSGTVELEEEYFAQILLTGYYTVILDLSALVPGMLLIGLSHSDVDRRKPLVLNHPRQIPTTQGKALQASSN
ncbi:hypothetical protein [Cohaesibacter haloalkalitolerans]|uniref:hypothetical protein n=1 Tax=Cohaesibacter haloalkalitolerans TaxID=1162980 RepID=UPI0013C48C99|nr:hypothetical protein [Cohaesibacter haloalkalitolerans]